ncbi:L-aspartate oxidase [Oligosphaera ethanolica]|jgi:L-aspartate oxidase|uniref:L-aspartate oxidase n=1 Tax=Oligosphaera ethanolica TaxID=760260 RepID=A0AAE3VJM4_9BACT|nr:L-aspartate oxidase [Oligosphaera ethanolica]MDQ0291541.1 L-aspartate oxidase [Oligosphaera ethanolica]NLE55281.1 L-aspartate oxidase [Lentisphaerota bacterium]
MQTSSAKNQRIHSEYLIIGSGLAGLTAALEAAKFGQVMVITKYKAEDCNTRYAQGGIACVIDENDTFDAHVADTITAGAGLCHPDVVREIVMAGPARVRDLEQYGLNFTRQGDIHDSVSPEQAQQFDLGREGGHSARRVLHAGDITGREVSEVLLARCRANRNITILENHLAVDLITTRHFTWRGENCCLGAYVMDIGSHEIKTFISRFTFLATGGAGKVYLCTCNPDIACGDGVAMAYRASAEIANMEFYQFHPTILFHPKAKSFLISEAVRGEGAILKVKRNGDYVEFMQDYHELKSLAPRDIVARAIDNELKRTGQECAWLDIRHKSEDFLRKRFPNIYQECLRFGVDMATDLIPVVPAAHYCCGGVRTDVNGVSTVKGLYAIGEVGCTGLHGANRLASNSLLEAMVVGYNAVKHSHECPEDVPNIDDEMIPDWQHGDAVNSDEQVVISHNWDEIRRFMWDYVGIVRTDKRLERAKNRIRMLRKEIEKYYWNFLLTPDLVELRNLASVAEMIIDSAIARHESRGLHYNLDYPVANSDLAGKDTILRRPLKPEIWFE